MMITSFVNALYTYTVLLPSHHFLYSAGRHPHRLSVLHTPARQRLAPVVKRQETLSVAQHIPGPLINTIYIISIKLHISNVLSKYRVFLEQEPFEPGNASQIGIGHRVVVCQK